MPRKRNIHFEISERKIFLRVFDVFWVLLTLYLAGIIFKMEYFTINSEFWVWTCVLIIYLTLFSSVFELYDLQKASKYDTVLKNVFLASSVTVLFFLLTPILTPVLPNNRLQIIYFYLAIVGSMLLWRFAYISFISSPIFYKRVLVIGDAFDMGLIADQLKRADPNYSVVSYLDTAAEIKENNYSSKEKIAHYSSENLTTIIRRHKVDEILISDIDSETERSDLNDQIFVLLRRGFAVKDFNQVYEEKTHRCVKSCA